MTHDGVERPAVSLDLVHLSLHQHTARALTQERRWPAADHVLLLLQCCVQTMLFWRENLLTVTTVFLDDFLTGAVKSHTSGCLQFAVFELRRSAAIHKYIGSYTQARFENWRSSYTYVICKYRGSAGALAHSLLSSILYILLTLVKGDMLVKTVKLAMSGRGRFQQPSNFNPSKEKIEMARITDFDVWYGCLRCCMT